MKGVYQHIRKTWKKRKAVLGKYVKKWRKEPVITRTDKPTRLDRARSLGYRAKQGFVLARVRVSKGGRHREKIRKGRRPKRLGRIKFTPEMSIKSIVERRVARRFPTLEVLNSYELGRDGKDHYYEVILVDPNHAAIKNDPKINWISSQRKRVFRGLTSAGKKSRAL